MNVTHDRKRGLIDFNMEVGEDHLAFTVGELQDIVDEARFG